MARRRHLIDPRSLVYQVEAVKSHIKANNGSSEPLPESITINGRPVEFHPTKQDHEMVWMLTASGVRQDRIAEFYGISMETLRRHFARELDKAVHEANGAVANALYQEAVYKGNVGAQIFWLKTRARWKEPQYLELSGVDGGPIRTEVHANLKKLTKAELIQLQELLIKAGGGQIIEGKAEVIE